MSQSPAGSTGDLREINASTASASTDVLREAAEVMARIEETRPLLSDLERLRSGDGMDSATTGQAAFVVPSMPVITRSIAFGPTTSTASAPLAEISQPNQDPTYDSPASFDRLASIIGNRSIDTGVRVAAAAPTSSEPGRTEHTSISRMMTSNMPTRPATISATTAPIVSRYRYRRPDPIRPSDSVDSSHSLLNSLHDLRTTLVDRVESLGAEIDMLRRRAQDLEREFVERDDPLGSGSGRPSASTRPFLLANPFRGDAELPATSAEQLASDSGDSTATTGTACPPHKRTGCGAAEIEGDRASRRLRRLAGLASAQSSAASSPNPQSRSQIGPERSIAARPWRPFDTVPEDRTRLRHVDITTRIAERQRDRRTQWDRVRQSNADLPRTLPSDSAITTRGRRVVDRFLADGDRQQQALPASASDLAATRWTNALTRYRDALVFGSHDDRNRPDSLPPGERRFGEAPQPERSPSPSDATRTAAEATASGIMGRLLEAARADAFHAPATTSTATATGEIGSAVGDTTQDSQRRVHAFQNATEAMQELQALSQRVSGLHDRLEAARRNFRANHSQPTSVLDRPGRRPSFPSPHTITHPHHRPRIGPDPIAVVVNCDNMNSFDINFDGQVVFRPISALEPDRELIARCLSMLPGGRSDTPSRWMRLTGMGSSRTRRPSGTAGFWVRWISQSPTEGEGLRRRLLDMGAAPRIVAFDFALIPPEDDPFVRADEVEFYTPRSRLRSNVGPWMHSRVRIEPFDTDPAAPLWGTSAHVRRIVRSAGNLQPGDFMRYNISTRTTTFLRGDNARSSPTPPSSSTPDATTAVPTPMQPMESIAEVEEGSESWLMAYEPALGQVRAAWRAHCRRQAHGPEPWISSVSSAHLPMLQDDRPANADGRAMSPAMWSRGK